MTPANDANYPSARAVWLRKKLPAPLLIISIVALPIFLYLFVGGLYVGRRDLVVAAICFGAVWLFLYTNNNGAKVAWDEDRVYMRA